jgi:hypothetical protein
LPVIADLHAAARRGYIGLVRSYSWLSPSTPPEIRNEIRAALEEMFDLVSDYPDPASQSGGTRGAPYFPQPP